MGSEKIDETNYYEHLEKEQMELMKLTRKQIEERMDGIRKAVAEVRQLKNKLRSDCLRFQKNCNLVKQKEGALLDAVMDDDKEIIRVDSKQQKHLKESINKIQHILREDDRISLDDIEISDEPLQEYIQQKTQQCNTFKIMHHKCESFMNDLKELVGKVEEKDDVENPKDGISTLKRGGPSQGTTEGNFHLSSTTFEFADLSASSPLVQTKKGQ